MNRKKKRNMHDGSELLSVPRCFCRQKNGAPMGSPLSPILVEVFTEHFGRQLFSHTGTDATPLFFKRYVDDVFAILPRGKEDSFLEIMNNEFPNVILFTIEKEVDGKLPFLDTLIIRSPNGIKTTVYRKPTHSDKYVDSSSRHPKPVLIGILQNMVDRAITICDPDYLTQEIEHIRTTFQENG
ncbi:hypothetical protein M514_06450, partial [Trichuris suis]|uniref:Helix-turn-helix domain-containing protein n=1 Tax=Trichuris suis TaxID=68888 RepID=A0A085N202_9BILA